jgi:competence protein ComEA
MAALVFREKQTYRNKTTIELESASAESHDEIRQEPASTPELWAVYITGEVKFPGVYEIIQGSRLNDAIDLAGGFTADADRSAVNLAAKLRDEAHIFIPKQLETQAHAQPQPEREPAERQLTRAVTYPDTPRESGAKSKIDINTAIASELASLPGIGPKLSSAIVAYRDEHGPFGGIEDLKGVRGIGEKRLEALKELITASN